MKIPELSNEPAINLALDTIEKKKQALIFVNTRRSAEKTAEDISKKINKISPQLNELSENILNALSRPTKQCKRLANIIKKGVAFHHAGLTSKQRELIEDKFREGVIRIIASTPTLAIGLDLPAYRAIIKDLRRFGPRGSQPIPVLEFLQMAGRAGRPKFDDEGQAICISKSDAEKEIIYNTYIIGQPEDIYSKLAVEPVLRTYLLSLIASEFVSTKEQILDFFGRTFWAHQFKDMAKLEKIIDRMLGRLEEWEFIRSSEKADFQSADEINSEKFKATIMGKRVAELYVDPYTASKIIQGLRMASNKHLHEFSFLQLVSSTLEMRPPLRVKTKEYDDMQNGLLKYESFLLETEPSLYEPEYDQFLNSIKTAFFFLDWIDEKDEEWLLEKFDIRPGEIRVKLNNADWLLYATYEMCRILHFQNLLKHISRLRLRLKNGAKEELLPMLKLKDIGRVRARKLFKNNIKDIADIKKVSYTSLSQVIGPAAAKSIKEQVGENMDNIKINPKKRKGQMSLSKY